MKKNIEVIRKSKLFKNINEYDTELMLNCLAASEKKYKKGQIILKTGDYINSIYMVLSGEVHILRDDYWGNQSILTEIGEGEIFGETYACMSNIPLQVNAEVAKDCTVMELNVKKVMTTCSAACKFHSSLIQNLTSVLAEKNLLLTNKLECMSERTIRDKVMSYLYMQSQKNGSSEFDIPFNRQQMADFLAVDRSAMSKELGKLRDEGILEFKRNHFYLK